MSVCTTLSAFRTAEAPCRRDIEKTTASACGSGTHSSADALSELSEELEIESGMVCGCDRANRGVPTVYGSDRVDRSVRTAYGDVFLTFWRITSVENLLR